MIDRMCALIFLRALARELWYVPPFGAEINYNFPKSRERRSISESIKYNVINTWHNERGIIIELREYIKSLQYTGAIVPSDR